MHIIHPLYLYPRHLNSALRLLVSVAERSTRSPLAYSLMYHILIQSSDLLVWKAFLDARSGQPSVYKSDHILNHTATGAKHDERDRD